MEIHYLPRPLPLRQRAFRSGGVFGHGWRREAIGVGIGIAFGIGSESQDALRVHDPDSESDPGCNLSWSEATFPYALSVQSFE